MDGDVPGGLDPQPHLVAPDLDERDGDLVVDDQALVLLPADEEHGATSVPDDPGGTVELPAASRESWSGWPGSYLMTASRAGLDQPDGSTPGRGGWEAVARRSRPRIGRNGSSPSQPVAGARPRPSRHIQGMKPPPA